MPIWNLRDNQNFIFDYFNQVMNWFFLLPGIITISLFFKNKTGFKTAVKDFSLIQDFCIKLERYYLWN